MTDTANKLAPALVPQPAIAEPAPQKKARPIPGKIKAAIEALQSGKAKSLTQAAKAAGITREYFSRTLSARPDVVEWGHNRARRLIAAGTWIATPQMLALAHSGSSRTSFEVCRYLLGIAGIKPAADAQVNVNVELKAGYVIDLSERRMKRSIDAVTGRLVETPIDDEVIEHKIVGGVAIDAKPEPIAGVGPGGRDLEKGTTR